MTASILFALACQSDSTVGVRNTDPEVELVAPTEGQSFHQAESFGISAFVSDAESPNEALTYAFATNLQGPLEGEQTVNDIGVHMTASGLEAGDHLLVVKAIDPGGKSGEGTVNFTIAPNEAPVVTLLSPEGGSQLGLGAALYVEVQVTDDFEEDLSAIQLEWAGVDSLDAPSNPDPGGGADFYIEDLELGTYDLFVTATDSVGDASTSSVAFEVVPADLDNDGYVDADLGGDDCNDGDAAVNPGADERCDGIDNDCDGETDEGDATDAGTWYTDADGDGYGDPATEAGACAQPSGTVENAEDCDDTDATISPDGIELCNDLDDDCDGTVDDNPTDRATWYLDSDGDGYGRSDTTVAACDQPSGYAADSTDCDDSNSSVSPAATEYCNGRDDDCDGDTDEDDAADVSTWYRDSDGDGYGDASTTDDECDQPSGYVSDDTDCDDTDSSVSPGATEVCDGSTDEDCDGTVDEDDASDASTWYADSDGDGYGDSSSSTTACDQPTGYVSDSTDCDDADATVSPAEYEYCDGSTDEDCDGTIDEDDAVDADTWWRDADSDGYGTSDTTTEACDQPSGYVSSSGDEDCDDSDYDVNPGVTETWYDGTDSDCDGASDYDQDGDGYDSEDYGGTDCDDTDKTRYPGSDTWYVPADYTAIQDAIDAACTLDTIEVSAGTYVENLDFGDKAIDLVGDGSATTTIDGDYNGDPVITLSAGSLSGFTITNGLALSGGGIYASSATDAIDLDDLIVTDNSASGSGGGARIYTTHDVMISDCEFSNNVAGYHGGGLDYEGSGDTLTVSDSSFAGNESNTSSSSYYGGGLRISSSDAALSDVDATGNRNASGRGGGVYLDGTWSWDGGTLAGNYGYSGGGLYARGVYALSNVDLTGNYAYEFGGARIDGSSGTVDSCTFDFNYAYSTAGTEITRATIDDISVSYNAGSQNPGLWLEYSEGTNFTIVGNVASSDYGRVLYVGSGTFDFSGVQVVGNEATGTRANVWLGGSGTLDDFVIAGNDGVGLYAETSSTSDTVELSNGTVIANTSHGVQVASDWVSAVDVRNVLSAHNAGYGLYSTGSYDPVLEYNDVYDNDDGDYKDVTDPTGSDGNVSVDPGFVFYAEDVDPTWWNLHLASTSSLIDAGDSAITDDDGTSSDIGAYAGANAAQDYYADDDGDGMYDGWEDEYGLDTSSDDSADDDDGDGLDNDEEFVAGTNPTVADTDLDLDEDGSDSSPLVNDLAYDVKLEGASSSAYAGSGLATLGDLDGDGTDELLVGSPGRGDTYLLYGPITSDGELASEATAIFDGSSSFGQRVEAAGDVDGDGDDDLLIADSTYSSYTGRVALLSSDFSGSGTVQDRLTAQITGDGSSDYIGRSPIGAGDLDGDGYDDIALGAYQTDVSSTNDGALALFLGPLSGELTLSDADVTWYGEEKNDQLGYLVGKAGDTDGDGVDELLVWAHGEDSGGANAGAAYLVSGPATAGGSIDGADARLSATSAADPSARSLGSAGDQDGDGYDDVFVGTKGAGYAGVVYVVLGPISSGSLNDSDGIVEGTAAYEYAGTGAGIGDADGDGNDDLAIGAMGDRKGGSNAGAVFVLLGPVTGSLETTDAHAKLEGEDEQDYLGYTVIGADVDGDGLQDIVSGAYVEDSAASNAGAVYVLFGSSL